MAYKPRLEIPGAYYHVVTRGNNKRPIAHDDDDYQTFLMLLSVVAVTFDWTIIAFVLMGNHYHLVLRLGSVEKGLSRGMCFLNTGYATEYNKRYERRNHLFGKRYWSGMIMDDAQLIRTCRYVLLNPVRAKLAARPEDWPWSSYLAMLGRGRACRRFDPTVLLLQFASDIATARERFVEFIEPAIAGPVASDPLVVSEHVPRQPP